MSSTQLDLGIEVAADAHFGASTREVASPPHVLHSGPSGIIKLFNAVDSTETTTDIVNSPPTIADGFLMVPEAPELRAELN